MLARVENGRAKTLAENSPVNIAALVDFVEYTLDDIKGMKKTLASLEEADKRNAEDIKTLDKNLNDLKADLPLIYVTREDYIRVMNRVEDKLDQILYGGKAKGKEE